MILVPGALAAPHHGQQPVGPLHPLGQQLLSALDPAQIGDPDAPPPVLILVGGADAAARSAQILAPLAGGVEQLVVGEHQMRPVGDEQPAGGIDAAVVELIELGKEVLRLQHDAVADHTGDALVQDAGRYLPEDELAVTDDDGVASVGPALIADHKIRPLGQHIDELPLALISPLCPNDHHTGGLVVEHVGSRRETTKEPLAGLLNPRANLSRPPRNVNSKRWPCRPVRRCGKTTRRAYPPRYGCTGACARSAVRRSWQAPPGPAGALSTKIPSGSRRRCMGRPMTAKLWLHRAGQALASRVVADQVELSLLVHGVDVHELGRRQVRR